MFFSYFVSFLLDDPTARSMIGYSAIAVIMLSVCLSVRPSLTLCIVTINDKAYTSKVYEQVTLASSRGTKVALLPLTRTDPIPYEPVLLIRIMFVNEIVQITARERT